MMKPASTAPVPHTPSSGVNSMISQLTPSVRGLGRATKERRRRGENVNSY